MKNEDQSNIRQATAMIYEVLSPLSRCDLSNAARAQFSAMAAHMMRRAKAWLLRELSPPIKKLSAPHL